MSVSGGIVSRGDGQLTLAEVKNLVDSTGDFDDLGNLCKNENININASIRPYKSKSRERYYTPTSPQSKPDVFDNIKYDNESSATKKTVFLKPVITFIYSNGTVGTLTAVTITTNPTSTSSTYRLQLPDTTYSSGDVAKDENYGWTAQTTTLGNLIRLVKFGILGGVGGEYTKNVISRLTDVCWYFNGLDASDGKNLYRLLDFDGYNHYAKPAISSYTDGDSKYMYLGAMGNSLDRVNYKELFDVNNGESTNIDKCFPNYNMYYIDSNGNKKSLLNSNVTLFASSINDTSPSTSVVTSSAMSLLPYSGTVKITNNSTLMAIVASCMSKKHKNSDGNDTTFVYDLNDSPTNKYRIFGVIWNSASDFPVDNVIEDGQVKYYGINDNYNIESSLITTGLDCISIPFFLGYMGIKTFTADITAAESKTNGYVKFVYGSTSYDDWLFDVSVTSSTHQSTISGNIHNYKDYSVTITNYSNYYIESYEIAYRRALTNGSSSTDLYYEYRPFIATQPVIGSYRNISGTDYQVTRTFSVDTDSLLNDFEGFYFLGNDNVFPPSNPRGTHPDALNKAYSYDGSSTYTAITDKYSNIKNAYGKEIIVLRVYFSTSETDPFLSSLPSTPTTGGGLYYTNILKSGVGFIEYQVEL